MQPSNSTPLKVEPSKLLELARGKIRLKHYSIRTVQELQRYSDIAATMVYAHVLNKGGRGVNGPLDVL
jgi:hypothetical protein